MLPADQEWGIVFFVVVVVLPDPKTTHTHTHTHTHHSAKTETMQKEESRLRMCIVLLDPALLQPPKTTSRARRAYIESTKTDTCHGLSLTSWTFPRLLLLLLIYFYCFLHILLSLLSISDDYFHENGNW
jgi:hypothetical protein